MQARRRIAVAACVFAVAASLAWHRPNALAQQGSSTPSPQILFNVKVEPSTVAAKVGNPPVMGALDAKFNGKPLSDECYKQFIAGPFHFLQQIDLPAGQLFVRVGILDGASNKVGTVEIPLTVGKKPAAPKPDVSAATLVSKPVPGEHDEK